MIQIPRKFTGDIRAMRIRTVTLACLSVLLPMLAPALHAAEGDAAAGKNKTAMCAGCHGIAGFRTAYPETYHVPKLGGQNAGYIVSALKAYKAGDRQHPTMKAIAASLSDQDMADLAAYYSSK
jgi:cytochrome c553